MTRTDYGKLAEKKKCFNCGQPLLEGELESYDHPNGYRVEGFQSPQWIYVVCPRCKYQNSMAKLKIEENTNLGEWFRIITGRSLNGQA